jgi:hypothetical protein
MLAYVFWHRPHRGADASEYEEAQRRFHERLEVPSACFRLEELPFVSGAAGAEPAAGGYEDWYLVAGWAELGELNAAAVDARHRGDHDRAAAMAAAGWGAVYAQVRGEEAIPTAASWRDKLRGEPLDTLLADIPGETPVWQRQLVLGPAPEFCIGAGSARARIA